MIAAGMNATKLIPMHRQSVVKYILAAGKPY